MMLALAGELIEFTVRQTLKSLMRSSSGWCSVMLKLVAGSFKVTDPGTENVGTNIYLFCRMIDRFGRYVNFEPRL